MRRCLAILLVSAASGSALAAEGGEEIVVTAPLEGSRIESLQGAEILRRDAIIQRQSGTLGDTLSGLPGISSTFYGAGAGRPIIRGLGDDRIRILENGIGAIDASSASPDHAVSADPLDARRIEVLRGAAALAYGGNAVGGVVNVIDESIPTLIPENGFSASALGSYTTVDDGWQGALGLTAAAGEFVFTLDLAARDAGDYAIPGFAESARQRALEEGEGEDDDEAFGTAPNSFAEVRSYAGGASLVRDWGFAGVSVKRFESTYGLPPEHEHGEGEEEEEHADEEGAGPFIELGQTRYETRGDVKLGDGFIRRLDWAAQYSDYTHTEFEAPGVSGTVFNVDGFEGRLELHNTALEGTLLGATGLQFTSTDFEAIGDEAFLSPTETNDIGIFTVQRWDRETWGLEGGLRLEHRDLDNTVYGGRDFTPVSLSAGFFLRPTDNWFAGVTLARTERAPTGTELFADGPHIATGNFEVGDPDLDIETATSVEGSLRYDGGGLAFELSVYRIGFDGYVALVPTGGEEDGLPVFAFVQRDAAFTGGEVSLSGRLGRLGAFDISADAAADLVRAEFDEGGDLPRIPPRTLTIGLEAESASLKARLEMVDIAGQDDVAAFELPTDGSTVLNASLAWKPVDGEDVTLLIDGRNLTDEEVRVHASFLKDRLPKPGASVRFAIAASY